MLYSAKAKRREDGGYDLSYGKGSKKLTAIIKLCDNSESGGGDVWAIHQGHHKIGTHKRKRDIMAKWEKWAASAYGGTDPESDTPRNDPPSEATDAPTDTIAVDDELSEYDRTLLGNIALHHGPLDEWQRSMLRNLLKRLTSAFDPKLQSYTVKRPFVPGPPKFVVNNESAPEVCAEPAESDSGVCSPDMGSEIPHGGEEPGAHGTGADGGIVGESEVAS